MNHALFAGRKFNERAEGHNTGNLAVEHIANLRITDDAVDDLKRTAAGLDIGRGNKDAAVFFDVNLRAGLSGDLLNDAAALADDLTDFSVSMVVRIILGAYWESSSRGSGIA